MDFDWKEYLEISKYLCKCNIRSKEINFSKEAAIRCAISRAYYSAYCHSRNHAQRYLDFHPATKNKWEDHERLRNHFSTCQQTEISERLQDLREWRNDCDYDLSLQFSNLSAAVCFQRSR